MLFEDNDFDVNLSLFLGDVNFSRETSILNPTEGFLRGNMFKDEYVPYKNLTFLKLNPTNEREKELYKLMALSFAINDLNLYLDLHPNDTEMFKLFKKFVSEEKELCEHFEKKYGPLEIDGIMSTYTWINNPWPWDQERGSKYV